MYLKIHVPFSWNQIERFIRIGIPPAIRGRVWKCLLNIDSLRAASSFDYEVQPHLNIYFYYYYYSNSKYEHKNIHLPCFNPFRIFLQACQAGIRRPLVDLGVSEYSIISSIDSLVDTENEISSGQSDLPSADLTLFKQIALDLRELCLWMTTEIEWYFSVMYELRAKLSTYILINKKCGFTTL